MLSKKDLMDIRQNTESKLVVDVIDILLDQVDNEKELDLYINQVLEYGLNTGICTSLLYTSDCREFVKNNIDEVLQVYNETRVDCSGIPEELDVNYLAWTAFEFICFRIKNGDSLVTV